MRQSSSSITKTQAQSLPARARPLNLWALSSRLLGLVVLGGFSWWLLATGPPADRALTDAEDMVRATAFLRAGPLTLTSVQPQERAQALQTMQLPAEQQQILEQQRTELVWLTVWDDAAEDGDMVAVESEGFRKTLVLTNTPQRLALPRPRAGAVTLTGVRDGGGGITVAAAAGAGQVGLPRLLAGQSIRVPIR